VPGKNDIICTSDSAFCGTLFQMSSFRGSPAISSADIARSPGFQSASSVSWDSALTPEDKQAYAKYFKLADEEQKGFITGQEAVKFFAKSGVPSQILAEVCSLI
jgi:ATP-dependent exoDNAse (exonuclease V) alpha subunit